MKRRRMNSVKCSRLMQNPMGPEGFARKVPSCGVARLVEQNERSTFVARLASEHFSCKRGSQRVLHQPAGRHRAKLTRSERTKKYLTLKSVQQKSHGGRPGPTLSGFGKTNLAFNGVGLDRVFCRKLAFQYLPGERILDLG